MSDFKERTDNPLHIKFGIGKNTIYIIGKIKSYCPSIIPIALIGMICGSMQGYFWGIVSKYIINLIEQEASVEDLLKVLALAGVIIAIINFGNTFSHNKIWHRFIFVRMNMITERVDRALRLNYEMLEAPEILDLHERATQATGGNQNGVEGMMHLMLMLGTSLFTVIVTFVAVTVLDWRLVMLLIGIGVLQFLFFRWICKRDKVEVWDVLAPVWRQANYMARITQHFDYAKDIRLFNLGDFLVNKQKEVFKRREERMDHHFMLWFDHAIIVNILFLVSKAFIYMTLVYSILNKGMSVGDLSMYLALALAFSNSLLQFMQRFGDYGRASLEVDDFRSFLNLNLKEKQERIPVPKAEEYTIEFHDVSYRYLKAEKNAVEHLNMTLHPGEKLAVVGLNGAGKTTMIKLLLRLYDPTEGYITLNGIDIKQFDREDYYQLFSPVFQDVEVFAFPIDQNISMKPAEETDSEQASYSAEEAGLGEKIQSLKKGIHTELLKVVDEEGVDFSGGEKQKLALARALYKVAPIVVLDEPTSALDAIAEQQLYERFDQMIGNKSAVYISHRLASTRFCDHIAMFLGGRMVEYGSHEELMEKGGEYAHMFNLQAQYYQEEQKEEVNA